MAALPDVIPGAMSLPKPLPGSVVTLGTFDGVHLGHRALIERATEEARRIGLPSIAYTFHPHPAKVLAPAKAPPLLQSIEERVRSLLGAGIARVLVEPFDAAFAEVHAEDWVERYLIDRLHPQHLVVGFNFSYGKNRGGDPETLRASGARHGFGVDVLGPIERDGLVVSSSRIRKLIEAGLVEDAAVLLAAPYALSGVVVEGDRRGHTIGVPTANLAPDAEVVPATGVYATWAETEDGVRHPSVTNIGRRPTFGGSGIRIETHLFDFEGDLYGKRLRVELITRIREERRFEGVDALVAQIRADGAEARRRLSR